MTATDPDDPAAQVAPGAAPPAPLAPASPPAVFLQGNLFRHVAVMSLTSSLGIMAIFAVDVVNMVFISWLGRAELAAAIGYAGAILFFTIAFGIGMSIAAAALVARALGQGNRALARKRAGHALIHGLWMGVVFAAVVSLFLGPLTRAIGASGETEALAVDYLRIVTPSLPLLIVGMIGGAILRAHGDARRSMMCTLYGAGVAMVLDPVFILWLGWELTGAAVVTVLARLVIGATALIPIIRHHGGFDRPTLAGLAEDLRPVVTIAFPAVLTQIATPAGQAYVTRAMAAFGEAAVAGMAITGRLTPLVFAVIFALSGAIGPIVGQNAGAGRWDRVAETLREGLVFTALVSVAVSVILFALRAPLADVFGATDLTREIVYLFCGPLSLLFFFNGAIFVANAACNNLGRPFQATLVNWGRHTLGTVPFVIAGAAWMGASGVLLGQAVGGILFAAVAVWQARRAIAAAEGARVVLR
jgi:putative MATE family efflux protein